MKQMKRILSLLLAVIMSVSLLAVSASAATSTAEQEKKAQVLFALGLFKGYDTTGKNFGLSDGATREQALLFLIRILGEEKAAEAWTGAQPYSDVPSGNYYSRYIGYAKAKGYTNGIGNNKFGFEQSANMMQMAAFALRGLGYSEAAGDFVYLKSLPFAVSLGILDSSVAPATFTRGDAVDILDGAVATKVKNQSYTLLEKLLNSGAVTQAQIEKAAAIAGGTVADIAAGTYTLKCMGKNLRVTSGKLELRDTSPAQLFTITNQNGYSYIQTADGYYIGITGLANGKQLVTGTTPYSWLIEKRSGSTYTIRPAEERKLVVNACEEKSTNGTKIIVWSHSGAPKNALITFTAATKKVPVTGVQLDQTAVKVNVGQTTRLTGTIFPSNATNQDVTWTSGTSSVAKVDSSGLVTGVKVGTAIITVRTADGKKTDTCKVTVTTDSVKLGQRYNAAVTRFNATQKKLVSAGLYTGELKTNWDVAAEQLNNELGFIGEGIGYYTEKQIADAHTLLNELDTMLNEMDRLIAAAKNPTEIVVPVRFVNNTGVNITGIFFSPTVLTDWGSSLGTLKVGETGTVQVTIDSNSLKWDLKLVDGSGTAVEFTGLDFSGSHASGITITLTMRNNAVYAAW